MDSAPSETAEADSSNLETGIRGTEHEILIKLERSEIQMLETFEDESANREDLIQSVALPGQDSQNHDPLESESTSALQQEFPIPEVPTDLISDDVPFDPTLKDGPSIYVMPGASDGKSISWGRVEMTEASGDEVLVDHLEDNPGVEAEEEEQPQHSLRIVGVNSIQEANAEELGAFSLEETDMDTRDSGAYLECKPIIAELEGQNLDGSDTEAAEAVDMDMHPGIVVPRKTDWRKRYRSHRNKLSYVMRTPGCKQDVAFIIGPNKERILAHSFILWMNSTVFEDTLNPTDSKLGNHTRSNGITEIVLEDIKPEVFKIILNYMYTEEISVNADNVTDVYKLAKKTFKIYELADYCQVVIKKTISLESAVQILQLAQEYQEDELYQEALFFILQNGEMILHSMELLSLSRENLCEILGSDHLAASEMTIFHAAIRWATNICFVLEQKPSQDNLRTALDQVIYKIRFPLMTAEEFKVDVVPTNILQPAEIIGLFSYFTPPYATVDPEFPFSTTPRLQHEVETNASSVEQEDTVETHDDGTSTSGTSSRRQCRPTSTSGTSNKSKRQDRSITRRRGRPVKTKKNRAAKGGDTNSGKGQNVINLSSSSSSETEEKGVKRKEKKTNDETDSEDEDEEWKKSGSEDSGSDSSDADFTPPPSYFKNRKRKQLRPLPEILPLKRPTIGYQGPYFVGKNYIGTAGGLGIAQQNSSNQLGLPISFVAPSKLSDVKVKSSPDNSNDLSYYIQWLMGFNRKDTITQINQTLPILEVPRFRVCLPNLRDVSLNLTSPKLENVQNVGEFKEVSLPILRCIRELIFFGTSETRGGKVRILELDRIWASGIKVNIILNGVRVFRSNLPDGDMACCFVRSPALQSIINGIVYRRDSLKRLIITECEFRLFPVVPTSSLRFLTILKVSGLDGINSFLQRCPNLRELHWDGNGVGYRIITLDEDLRLFSPDCKLKRLVISNALISLKNQFAQAPANVPSKVLFPLFFFCEFSPHVIQNFAKIFPNVNQIHFRNYPMISFFEQLLDMESMMDIGIWGAKLITRGPCDNMQSMNFTTFVGHNELKTKIKKENIPNKMGKYVGHAFFLKRKGHITENSLPWAVTETVKDADVWQDVYLQKIYISFQYATVLEFSQFKKLFSSYY